MYYVNVKSMFVIFSHFEALSENLDFEYRSRAVKSRSKLGAAIGLRAAFGIFLLHQKKVYLL